MKAVIKSLDEVAEPLRGEYKQEGNVFVLKLEGENEHPAVKEINTKLGEFRDNNRDLNAKVTELTTKFKDIDPTAVTAMKTELETLKADKAKVPAKDAQIEALQTQLNTIAQQLEASNKATQAATLAQRQTALETALTKAGLKAGIAEAALPDYIARGKSVFSVADDGTFVAKDGTRPLYSKVKVTEPLSVDEWAVDLNQSAPHLFKPTVGGGSQPFGGPAPGVRTIEATDPLVLGQNIADIAAGKVAVVMPNTQ